MNKREIRIGSFVLFSALSLLAPAVFADADISLPKQLHGKADVVHKDSADYARADIDGAVKAAGEGGITQGLVVRLKTDLPIWRLWNGPTKKDARGFTNRMGQWWSYDKPHGTKQAYRHNYEICNAWNELTWVAKCTLKKGAVVVIGPGNSVSAKTCGDASGQESYPINRQHWQIYISKIWARSTEVECPDESLDYEASPADISAKISTPP